MAQLKVIADKLNKRSQIPTILPDSSHISGIVFKDYSFEGNQAGTNALGTWYVDRDNNFYWGNALEVVPSVPATTTQPVIPVSTLDLPVNRMQCLTCASWLDQHFGDKAAAVLNGTPFEKHLIYAIACQETAIYWFHWINDHTPDEILARCVFDASGDANGSRSAFPKNTPAFIEKYGQEMADMLIAEANATRALHGWAPKPWVYAGYGIFQYDIQAILTDPDFFEKKLWYSMDECLDRILKELHSKWQVHEGDLFNTVKAYNGAGPRAESYANNVMQFLSWIKTGA